MRVLPNNRCSYLLHLRRLSTTTATTAAMAKRTITMTKGNNIPDPFKSDPVEEEIELGVITAGSNENPVLSLYLNPSKTTSMDEVLPVLP